MCFSPLLFHLSISIPAICFCIILAGISIPIIVTSDFPTPRSPVITAWVQSRSSGEKIRLRAFISRVRCSRTSGTQVSFNASISRIISPLPLSLPYFSYIRILFFRHHGFRLLRCMLPLDHDRGSRI